MRKNAAILTLILMIMLAAGCQTSTGKTDLKPEPQSAEERTTLAALGLGDSTDDVKKKLGNTYTSESLGADWFGESASRWNYGDELEIIVGDETQKILQINLYGDSYATTQGDKVGYKAEKVLPLYQKYPLAKDHFEGKEIPGWFEVQEGIWLIFNFKDDNTMVNQPIEAGDQVKSIHLVYEKYMD